MATLREIIYSIRESLQQYSHTSDISNEYLQYLVNHTRALLLQQRFSNRSFIVPQKVKQNFNLELELVEANPYFNTGDKLLISTTSIPKPLEPFNIKSGMKVGNGDYGESYFNLVSLERFPYVGYNKYFKNQVYYTIAPDFKLIFNSANPKYKLMENVRLSMVTENPEDAYPYTIEYDSTVDFIDTEYPLENDMIIQVEDLILKRLVNMLNMPEDKTNDQDDN